MVKILTILLIIFSFQSLTSANDISEFQIEDMSIGDNLLNYFTNIFSSDIIESLGVGGSQVALNRVINYFTRKDKSLFGLFGVTKSADEYAAAFERLANDGYDIAPLVHAQLLQWPLLRGSFFQAKDFVKFPKQVIDNQSIQLYKAFEKFGHKLAVEGGGKGDELSFNQLVKLTLEILIFRIKTRIIIHKINSNNIINTFKNIYNNKTN